MKPCSIELSTVYNLGPWAFVRYTCFVKMAVVHDFGEDVSNIAIGVALPTLGCCGGCPFSPRTTPGNSDSNHDCIKTYVQLDIWHAPRVFLRVWFLHMYNLYMVQYQKNIYNKKQCNIH